MGCYKLSYYRYKSTESALKSEGLEADFEKNCANSYRYSFQGMEKNEEWNEGSYDFGARMYDGRSGRWLAVDALARKYSHETPYVFVSNCVLRFIDPDGDEKIVVAGAENRSWKLAFVLSAMKQVRDLKRELKESKVNEQVTLAVFKGDYTDKQLNRIKKFAVRNGVNFQQLGSANELVNYINNKNIVDACAGRDKDPITEMYIYSHGLPNQIAFGYEQSAVIQKSYEFNGTHVDKIDPYAFAEGAVIRSFACRTGASLDVGPIGGGGEEKPQNSLAQKLANKTGAYVFAQQNRSDYESIIPDERDVVDVLMEKSGMKDPDQTYNQNAGSWDSDQAVDKIRMPVSGTTPLNSPGTTLFRKGKAPTVVGD